MGFMRKLLTRIVLLGLINLALGVGIQAWFNTRLHFAPYETDSVLLSTSRNTTVDFLLMGTSRAKVLTRFQCNYEAMRQGLHGTVASIALPFGGGIVPEKLMFQSFLDRGNRAKTIFYLVEPFVFYSHSLNRQHRFVYYEPLEPKLLGRMAFNHIPPTRIFTYIQSKFSYEWFAQVPQLMGCNHAVIEDPEIDEYKVALRSEALYSDGTSDETFRYYTREFEQIIEIGRQHGSRFAFILAPTLLGDELGKEQLMNYLKEIGKRYNFPVYDFSNELRDLKLYSDYDHLNAEGVQRFVNDYLKPGIDKAGAAPD